MSAAGSARGDTGGKKSLWTRVDNGVETPTYLSVILMLGIIMISALGFASWIYIIIQPYDSWADILAAHPDAGMECHMAIMERIQDTEGLVYGSPYAVDDSGQHMSGAEITELATHMVLDSDWRPPECGG